MCVGLGLRSSFAPALNAGCPSHTGEIDWGDGWFTGINKWWAACSYVYVVSAGSTDSGRQAAKTMYVQVVVGGGQAGEQSLHAWPGRTLSLYNFPVDSFTVRMYVTSCAWQFGYQATDCQAAAGSAAGVAKWRLCVCCSEPLCSATRVYARSFLPDKG